MDQEIVLRKYQNELDFKIRKSLSEKYKHILAQLPTGGGKTVIFSSIAHRAAKKGNKVLILTDRDELLKQAGKSMGSFGINSSLIKAGAKFIDHRKSVYVAMSQTLRNRIKLKEWREWIKEDIDVIIIDECHIQEFNYIFEDGILEEKIVLGFTATPARSGKMRQLGLDYEVLVRGPEVKELIEMGFLVNCDMFELDHPDMTGVKINHQTGDYQANDMYSRFNSLKYYQGLLKNYQKHADGKKMIVFCCNVEHAIKTTIQLCDAGYSAKFICSDKNPPKAKDQNDLFQGEADRAEIEKYNQKLKEYNYYRENFSKYSGTRKHIIDGFRNDEFQILVNVDIATKGFDVPDIEVVAIYRATNSLTLWLQMLGRGGRITEGKESFIAFDFGGNAERLGNYDDIRNWSLWHETGKDKGGVPPLKECGYDSKGKAIKSGNSVEKGCRRLILASQVLCPFCGYKYPDKKDAKEVELVLSEIFDEKGVALAFKSFKEMTWDELETYRKAKKHRTSWLWRQLWNRGKAEEIRNYGNSKHWSNAVIVKAINYCESIYQYQ